MAFNLAIATAFSEMESVSEKMDLEFRWMTSSSVNAACLVRVRNHGMKDLRIVSSAH